MLYMFDLDGTLISSYMDSPDKDFHAWHVLPGRTERIAALVDEGHEIAIVTNQAGVAFGYNTPSDVTTKLILVARALGFVDMLIYDGAAGAPHYHGYTRSGRGRLTAHVAYGHPKTTIERYREEPDAIAGNRRKPSPVMLDESLDVHGENAIRAIMIGDRPEDQSAAHNAGVRFVWAEEFFHGR